MEKPIGILLFIYLVVSQGCGSDLLNSDEKTVVGNIILINSHVNAENGFRLNYYTGSYNRNLIQEYVASLYGNDSVLIVKTKDSTGYKYFEVKHNKGSDPIDVVQIDSIVGFRYFAKNSEPKYHFEDDK